jgi:hypothetical protein
MLTPDEYAQLPEEEKYPPHIPGSPQLFTHQEQEEEDMKRGWCWYLGPHMSSRHYGLSLPIGAPDEPLDSTDKTSV